MKRVANVLVIAAIVGLCILARECPAGDCRGVLQIQSYAAPVQQVQYVQKVQQVQAYAVVQPQYVQQVLVQRVVQPQYVQKVQVQQVQKIQRVQVVQQRQFVQQPQRVIVRERVVDNGGRRNVQVGLFNFGR